MAAALFAALNVVPVILLVRQALLARTGSDGTLEWYPPGLLTAWLTGLGLAVITGAVLLLGGPDSMQSAVREALAPALDRLFGENTADRDEFVGFLAMIMPGYRCRFLDGDDGDQRRSCARLLARFGGELAAVSSLSPRSVFRCGSRCFCCSLRRLRRSAG